MSSPPTGPLLWHWEGNTTNDPSIELTLDEVKALARKIGFEISVRVAPRPPAYPYPSSCTVRHSDRHRILSALLTVVLHL